MSTDTRLRGLTRWSAAARCPRWAAMGLLGNDPAEPSDRTRRLWLRGKQLGAYMGERFEQKYGDVVLEKAVPWPAEGLPLGELHTDVYVRAERMAVEVKSSTAPTSILEAALTQLAGEIHFDPDADVGALAILNPSDLGEELLPFVLTAAWVDRVEGIAEQVAHAGKTGTLPDCSCTGPRECRYLGCPFTEQAWEGWEPLPAGKLDGEAATVAADLYRAKKARDERRARAAEFDEDYQELALRLLELGVEPGVEYSVDGLRIRCSEMSGRETFSLSRARKTNIWTPEHDVHFAPFLKIGEAHYRWTLDRVDGDLPEHDFGDEAPF